ncbi:sulfate ABC transporter permease subunit CysT [Alishewanella longhuensis]
MSKQRVKRVLPGFTISLGSSLFFIGLVILLPLTGLVMETAKLTLPEYWAIISDPRVVASYKVTASAALVASIFNLFFGLLMAWILTRYRFPGRLLLDGLMDLPFALPTAVAGLTLAALFSTQGWYGQYLALWDIKVSYTWLGIVVAMTFTSVPFVVRTVQPVLEEFGPEYEEASATLGATPFQTFYRVILPEIKPALLTGTAYCLTEREVRLRVAGHSPLLNQPLNALALRSEYGINVVAVERPQKFRTLLLLATGQTVVQPGDILLVDLADPQMSVMQASAILGLEPLPLTSSYFSLHAHELGLAEVAFPPESSLPGKSIQQLAFRSRYRLNVLGIRRNGKALNQVLVDEKLQATDTILVAGTWQDIQQLHRQNRDFLVLSVPAEIDEMTPAAKKAPHALACLALMVVLMVSNLVPAVVAVLITCLLLGACRCIDLASAYKAISWPSILLIVGMLPFAQALQQTGGIDLLVNQWLALMGNASYYAVLAAVFMLTTLLSLFISNTATAVLMAPVAISLASAFQASPYPFAMMVALGASAAFMTPVASPVNTLVLGPGQYTFSDFLKIGTPFTLIVLIISVILVPWLFPLHPN